MYFTVERAATAGTGSVFEGVGAGFGTGGRWWALVGAGSLLMAARTRT